jgi:hypothetical protein
MAPGPWTTPAYRERQEEIAKATQEATKKVVEDILDQIRVWGRAARGNDHVTPGSREPYAEWYFDVADELEQKFR